MRIKEKQEMNDLLRKIKKLEDEKAEEQELAKAEKHRIEKWLEERERSIDYKLDYYNAILENYLREQGKKSVKLPFGTIRYRKRPEKFKYDYEKVIDYLKKHYPEEVKTVEKFDKNSVKKLVKEHGEIPEGVEIEEQEAKFEVKTEKC